MSSPQYYSEDSMAMAISYIDLANTHINKKGDIWLNEKTFVISVKTF